MGRNTAVVCESVTVYVVVTSRLEVSETKVTFVTLLMRHGPRSQSVLSRAPTQAVLYRVCTHVVSALLGAITGRLARSREGVMSLEDARCSRAAPQEKASLDVVVEVAG